MASLTRELAVALEANGAREIFGLPGDFALPMFGELERAGILPLYTLSHEPAVGFAADAAARFNCGLGVAVVTFGAGAINTLNAIACAYAERSPVVLISGAPALAEFERGLLVHHQVRTKDSQLELFREVTCDQAQLSLLSDAPAQIARVLRSAREMSRPVYLEVPRDLATQPCAPVPMLGRSSWNTHAAAECAEEILARVKNAERPVLLVGVEVRRYGLSEQVAELARRLELPVVTTFLGRGLLTGAGVDVAGTYLGLAGNPEVTALVENADALLILGAVFSDTNFGIAAHELDLRRSVLATASEVRVSHHVYQAVPLSALLEALLDRVPVSRNMPASAQAPSFLRGLSDDAEAITPECIARAINDAMDVHGVMPVTADMGDCLFAALDIEHTELAAPACYATMGFGVPAALGVQATTGRRPIVLVGDGAFRMTGWELGNCARYGWDPIVVVFNNASWEMLRVFQPSCSFSDLERMDFASLAPLLGGVGYRVALRRELSAALNAALTQRGRFQLLDVQLERGALSPTLRRFVDALQATRSTRNAP